MKYKVGDCFVRVGEMYDGTGADYIRVISTNILDYRVVYADGDIWWTSEEYLDQTFTPISREEFDIYKMSR